MKHYAAAIIAALIPAWALAQTSADLAAQMAAEDLADGDRVRITYEPRVSGGSITVDAAFVGLDGDAIIIELHELPPDRGDLPVTEHGAVFPAYRVAVPWNRVRRIERRRRDGLVDGTIMGAALGAGVGLAYAVAECSGNDNLGNCRGEAYGGSALVGGLFGAGIGVLVDALRQPPFDEIYVASGGAREALAWDLSPVLSSGKQGVRFTVIW